MFSKSSFGLAMLALVSMAAEAPPRVLAVPNRQAKRRRASLKARASRDGRRGNKLWRRLQRKFELGMSGSF
jgi:hypothetical protein